MSMRKRKTQASKGSERRGPSSESKPQPVKPKDVRKGLRTFFTPRNTFLVVVVVALISGMTVGLSLSLAPSLPSSRDKTIHLTVFDIDGYNISKNTSAAVYSFSSTEPPGMMDYTENRMFKNSSYTFLKNVSASEVEISPADPMTDGGVTIYTRYFAVLTHPVDGYVVQYVELSYGTNSIVMSPLPSYATGSFVNSTGSVQDPVVGKATFNLFFNKSGAFPSGIDFFNGQWLSLTINCTFNATVDIHSDLNCTGNPSVGIYPYSNKTIMFLLAVDLKGGFFTFDLEIDDKLQIDDFQVQYGYMKVIKVY